MKTGIFLITGLAILVVAALLFSCSKTRYRVQSCSMSPAWNGPGFLWSCPKCSGNFFTSLDIQRSENAGELHSEISRVKKTVRCFTCPHCGFPDVPFTNAVFTEGDIVQVRRYSPFHRFRRWEPVFVELPSGRRMLKRIVGLPGEELEIKNGDIWINGRLIVKSLNDQTRLLVPVSSIRCRWLSDRVIPEHVSIFAENNGKTNSRPAVITNQSPVPRLESELSERCENVQDFAIFFDFSPNEKGTLSVLIQASDQNDPVVLLLTLNLRERTVILKQQKKSFDLYHVTEPEFDGTPVTQHKRDTGPLPKTALKNRTAVQLFYCDGRLRLLLDGSEVFNYQTGGNLNTPNRETSAPIALLTSEGVENIRLFRDVHYSSRFLQTKKYQIPAHEYFLLGDNSPVSIDSRFSEISTVPQQYLKPLGRR